MHEFTFGKNLEAILREKNMSQTSFAKLMGKSDSTISQRIVGVRKPSLDHFHLICQALGVSADTLLDVSYTSNPYPPSPYTNECYLNEEILLPSQDLKALMQNAISTTGYEEDARYMIHIRHIFCLAVQHFPYKDKSICSLLLKLFYIDYMLLILTFSKSVSPFESSSLTSKPPRNFYIGQVLLILLPHNLNDTVSVDFQRYIYQLLGLEKYPDLRIAVKKLYCIAALSLTWMESNKNPNLLLESMQFSLPLATHIINAIFKNMDWKGSGIKQPDLDIDNGMDQQYYIHKRNQVKQTIEQAMKQLQVG